MQTNETAARYAATVIGQYHHQLQDAPDTAKAMGRCLREIFRTKPTEVLEQAVHPELGIAAKFQFLSLADVNKWVEAALRRYHQNRPVPERVQLEKLGDDSLSPEERARRAKIMRARARELRKSAKPGQLSAHLAKLAESIAAELEKGAEAA